MPALACAGLPREFPERAEDDERLVAGVQLITTEIDPATLEQLTQDLVTLVDGSGYAIAVRYDPRAGAEQIELLPDCQVPVHYSWVTTLAYSTVYDTNRDLFVTPNPGRPNIWERLGRGAHTQSRVERVARIDDHPRQPVDHPTCAGATHVLSEFSLGAGLTDDPEALVAVWLEPLADPEQQRWLVRRDRRRAAGNVALSVLGTVALASLAVVCLADVDNCDSDDDDDGFYADDGEGDYGEASPRSGPFPIHPPSPMRPSPGIELGRGKRAKLEAGGGGLRLRF